MDLATGLTICGGIFGAVTLALRIIPPQKKNGNGSACAPRLCPEHERVSKDVRCIKMVLLRLARAQNVDVDDYEDLIT